MSDLEAEAALLDQIDTLEARVAELETAQRGLLDGLDDHWVTLPEGIAALEAARAALAAEKGDDHE